MILKPLFAALALICGAAILAGVLGSYLPLRVLAAPLDIGNSFLPFWLIGLGIVLLALLWLRAGSVTVLVIGCLVLLVGAVPVAREFLRPIPRGEGGEPIRLVQYNMLANNRAPDGAFDLLRESGADVVTIPEPHLALVHRDRFSQLFPYVTPCEAPCQVIIASRVKPLKSWSETLPAPSGEAERAPGQGLQLAFMRFGDPREPFTVVAVHYTLPIPPWAQEWQVQTLAARLAKMDRTRVVLAGDFNLTPWALLMRHQDELLEPMTRITRGLPSYPTSWFGAGKLIPFLPIDHIYVGSRLCSGQVQRIGSGGSDHTAIATDLSSAGPCA